MKRRIQVQVAVAGLCLILACAAAWSQATTATVLGTVKDSTGASVPNANVTAINTDTNFSRLAVSDPTGH